MLRFVRLLGGALGVILAIALAGFSETLSDGSTGGSLLLLAWILAWAAVGFAIMPYITITPAHWLMRAVTDMSTDEFVAAVVGLVLGLLMGFLLGLPLTSLPAPAGLLMPIGVSIVLALGMMGLTVAKRQDLRDSLVELGLGRHAGDDASPDEHVEQVTYADTSAIIDGRIVDVVASGFLGGLLVVPRFVLGELQHIADDSHPGRRNRGRRGMDVLSVLQKDHRIEVEMSAEDDPGASTVDAKLVALALKRNAAILTTDYNLNRVAQLQGVRVMNLNQLANALKPAFLPGEELRVKVIQEGKEPGQGVAFLDDGTMVVVEGGSAHIEGELDVTVTRILQTVAGRIDLRRAGERFLRPRPAGDARGSRDRTGRAGHTCAVISEGVADAVVVAAGSSRRMGGGDKLELAIAGRPILRWTVEALAAAPEIGQVIVVTAEDRVDQLRDLPWLVELGARVVPGGPRRQDSTACGVRAAGADIVLVHDAARPFVSPALVSRVVAGVQEHGAAIPALPVVDALKQVEGAHITASAQRTGLYRAQTPQGARRELLLAAAEAHANGDDDIPDEADLLARHGVSVAIVPGDADNIKVTLPEDLALARRLAGEGTGMRVAHGSDSHPFGPGDGLRLGGLLIEGAPRLHGHSDGDAVLHALCDALLAAAGAGDLGRLFPPGERRTRGIDSRELVAEVVRRVEAAGLEVISADVTILGARPRFGGERLDAMAAAIAAMLSVPPSRVSVKAATGNLSGDEGAGRAISASCLAAVVSR